MDASSLLLLLLSLLSCFSSLSSLSTVSISDDPSSNQTIICALIRSPRSDPNQHPSLNCTSFPSGVQVPLDSPNVSYSGIEGGAGFLTALMTFSSSSTSVILRWRFPPVSPVVGDISYARIYRGSALGDLDAGSSHVCGILEQADRLECWQWRRFGPPRVQNLSSISVGDDFVCGLSGTGRIRCLGGNLGVVGREPSGENYSVIAAGSRHACAVSINGSLDCWGELLARETPQGEYTSVALGENRSCALRRNGTLVCWGEEEGFTLPERLRETRFVSVEGKGRVFCGVLQTDFSLYCWGMEMFESLSPNLFDNVLPGPCRSNCPCTLDNSGHLCRAGFSVCQPCVRETSPMVPRRESPPPSSSSSSGGLNGKLVAFLVVGCIGSVSLVITLCFLFFRYCKVGACRVHDSGRMDEAESAPADNLGQPGQVVLEKRLSHMFSMENGGNLEEFPLQALLEATDNFSENHRIGSGSFGSVYHAVLPDGREVAIKRAETSDNPMYHQDDKDKDSAFLNELESLSRLNHKNLVRLLGFCEDGRELMLVYEYMANGSLHDHLHSAPVPSLSPLMSWTARINVAVEAARGIQYLHEYAIPTVIHRDIKSANILLDSGWTAKVSDFGLSLMGPDLDGGESHLSLRAAGTVGYIDPEYYRLQQLTTKSDVYSFGIVLLELLCGKKAIHKNENGVPRNVVDFVVPYIVQDEIHRVLDRRVPAPTPYEIEAVVSMGYLAADCVMPGGRDRPSMGRVVGGLERALTACSVLPPSLSPRSSSSGSET